MKLKGWGGLGVVRKRYDHHDNKNKEERSSLSGPGPAYAEARAPASTSLPKESTKMIMGDGRFSFDTNMVIILAALLCALICALGLNSMFRYALTCRRSSSNTRDDDGGEEEDEEQQIVLRMRLGMKRRAWKALPAPVEVSKKMNKNVEEEEEEECCAICLGDVVEGDKVRILPKCNHAFHVHCIDTWLVSHSSCPICRQNLNMLNILSSPSHLNYT